MQVSRFGKLLDVEPPRDAIYSGTERTGFCECSHQWDRHHLQLVISKEWIDSSGEEFFPAECTEPGCKCPGYHDTGIKKDYES